MGKTSRLMQDHNVTIRIIGAYSHRGLAIVERFNQTLTKNLYKIQYAVESVSSDPKLIRAWVRHLRVAVEYLNNYPTRLIREPGSEKWGLAPAKAILLERVESRPSLKYKRPVGKDEEILKKGDTVRYLLAIAEWEGGMENQRRATDPIWSPSIHKIQKIIVSKNKPVLYYLDGEFTPSRGFVREELSYLDYKPELPPQSILGQQITNPDQFIYLMLPIVKYPRPKNMLKDGVDIVLEERVIKMGTMYIFGPVITVRINGSIH
ncbi:hypothetical protein RhiirA4_426020 [Rhizophagus irregularis]|uniref:Integrase catalytic domain-containing protein n=1 Tax=Rhizophagus irregularis TaxID=588596 RepID=A0A2I1H3K2_9GLOM|nr:hypothetical protein RhiirA4_426020 [Rhizophagus irregularis]